MKITFIDINPPLIYAWKTEGLTAFQGDLFSIDADAVVSPGNSFGFMDGNVDLRISHALGWHVMERLQETIRRDFDGELLVGQAVSIPTDHPTFKYVISAPTMRIPLIITDPIDIYLATRAAVRSAKKIGLDSLNFTGMGTGCGRVRPDVAANMMRKGMEHGLTPPAFPTGWKQAQRDHFAWKHELGL
ncbi:Appr-1-p processing protein [Sinorhizobium phage phiM7]|uniref:Appr-1-p processing protein n=2 Tax=Emdodecavirus TaxID=1980937 RepID=S5M726_9CAUD|nr:Appr-1-p processing protein [Sinorhizobium phage phiM12]YP_009601293.1 Appr-1-p processing protein [Sinorhizobium phage phiM7]AGR47871.1 Appr-1-p processing protein [Sinorhizobium phage phiM12]AKF12713.1 Appr-1-p processing protein [Sinorhizobium phage phiM7]AKF13073.1 Appr-1-p processing enzyme [Sinorhizobium phage phiM19]